LNFRVYICSGLISAYDLLELLDELGNISGYSNFAESASFNLSIF